jgi:tripartite-type tricarboxylate transporter receptor subunit TctC
MRSFIIKVTAAVLLVASGPAMSQAGDYPNRPIRMIVAYPPGGGIDQVARPLAEKLGVALGRAVVIDNRGGAGGMIGTEAAAKAAPDGYTLLLGDSGSLTINPAIYKSVPYKVLGDFEPISLLVTLPQLVAAHPSLGASTLKDALEIAKKSNVDYGSAGNGSLSHLIMESIRTSTGANFVHIPYKGAELFTGFIGGQVKLIAASHLGMSPFIARGQAIPLAVTTRQRLSSLPNVPTISESGIPGFEAVNWFGVLTPRGTPKSITDRLNAELVKIVNSPDMKERLNKGGADVVGSSPSEFLQVLQSDLKRWEQVVKDSGAKID